MADGINELNQKTVNDVVHGMAVVLDVALISIEEIAVYGILSPLLSIVETDVILHTDSWSTCTEHSFFAC